MKNLLRITVLGAAALVGTSLTSCESFLDVTPTDKVSPDFVFDNYNTACSVMGGIYDMMTYADVPGSWSMTPAASKGIHNFLIAADLRGSDLIYRDFSSDQFQGHDYAYASRLYSHERPKFFWSYCYTNIYAANDVLANVEKMKGTSVEKKQIEGEARFIRGYMYWMLCQWFQHTYLINPSAPAVPLYLTTTVIPQQRASLETVYDAIIKDLSWAATNMPNTRRSGSKFVPNADVANGVLARVYMDMGKYGEALPIAKKLAESYPLMSDAEYKSGFNNVQIGECIWGLPTSERNGSAGYCMPSVYSHPRLHGRWGQKRIYINDSFRDLFSATDIRKSVIVSNPNAQEIAKSSSLAYVTTKIQDEASKATGPNVILMRGAEMLLIEAECLARGGKDGEAQDVLFKLQQKRDPSAVKTAAVGADLINQIFEERRKELFGEGFGCLDYKRFRKPIVRTGNHAHLVTIPADDKEFVFQIPSSEIQVNPMTQND